jgi:hypothetical protein
VEMLLDPQTLKEAACACNDIDGIMLKFWARKLAISGTSPMESLHMFRFFIYSIEILISLR